MRLTKHSKELLSFFIQNNCINHERITTKTQHILLILYNQLKIADNMNFQNIKKTIRNISIKDPSIKPTSFELDSFPTTIIKHIDSVSMFEISYNFSLEERNINVHFILENKLEINKCDNYITLIMRLMYILTIYSHKKCSRKLDIFIYMTSLKKYLPETNAHILDQIHVNTAFTRTCMPFSEIVIFRKEEWFKVLIHESFHNFGLDFSDMDNTECHSKILNIFKVESKVNLFEAYTEFWAEIINAVFCSYFILTNKNNVKEFISNMDFFINFERSYSFFQLVKTLNFMGLKYDDLYSTSLKSKMLRNSKYKEKSNILSYYIIKTILIHNFQIFLSWCQKNNSSLLQFNKTRNSQTKLCDFIEHNHNSITLINEINKSDNMFMKGNGKNHIFKNMRMSISELG